MSEFSLKDLYKQLKAWISQRLQESDGETPQQAIIEQAFDEYLQNTPIVLSRIERHTLLKAIIKDLSGE